MKTFAINSSQTCFGALYKANSVFMSEQEKVAGNITKKMQQPVEKFKGQSSIAYYKKHKNIDFIMEPYAYSCVKLMGYKNMKEDGVGIDKKSYADYEFKVGIYDSAHPLEINDIVNAAKEAKRNDNLFLAIMIVLGLGILSLMFNKQINGFVEKYKTPVEKVDTVSNKAKAILTDTIKFNIKDLKKIK